MKKWLWVILSLLLAGCQAAAPAATATSAPTQTLIPTSTPSVTSTNSPTPTRTFTPSVTRPRAPTLTFSPSPTATITPTITLTPVPTVVRAGCPVTRPDLVFHYPDSYDPVSYKYENILKLKLDFLNAGGDPRQFTNIFQDLTGDGVPEVVDSIMGDPSVSGVNIYQCKNGLYQRTFFFNEIEISNIHDWNNKVLPDINKNGYPEILSFLMIGFMSFIDVSAELIEWNGDTFVQLIKANSEYLEPEQVPLTFAKNFPFLTDINNDGIREIEWTIGSPYNICGDDLSYYPTRLETHILQWDGKNYVPLPIVYSAPEYRYQAVQDGDRYSLSGEYQRALASYKRAMDDDSLKWWDDNLKYESAAHRDGWCAYTDPYPKPVEDPNEKPILAAYATFRTMLIHLILHNNANAQYELMKFRYNFPEGNPGHGIAEMAFTFWDKYQASGDMGTACSEAHNYFEAHPDTLKYLNGSVPTGNSEINNQYKPFDTCPFKSSTP